MNISDLYLEIVSIWKFFCEKHGEIFQLTCDEYAALLSNNIEKIEQIVSKKEDVISEISCAEQRRKAIINLLNQEYPIHSIVDLYSFFCDYEDKEGEHYLYRYNELLIDIIEKIQEQNKRNQLYINKSLISLKEIREGLSGFKTFNTYNAMGRTNDPHKK